MKGLEALNCLINKIPLILLETNSTKYIEDIEKELKALEIIRKSSFLINDSHGERIIISIFDHFTPDSVYYLIKEVLIHDKSSSSK